MNSQTHVLLAVFGLFLGCTSNSGRAGSTSSTQAQGGNISAGGSAATVSSSSSTSRGTSGASAGGGVAMGGTAIGGSAISGSTGGGSVASGTSGGSMASGGASAATTFAAGGSGPVGTGGISTMTGGSSSGGETGATSAAAGAGTGGIAAGGVSTVTGGVSGGAGSGGATATSVGGQTRGGTAIGGTTAGGTATGGTATGGSSSGGTTPGITKDSEVLLTNAGLMIVSYGGYLNGESFQQDGIVSYSGYQYAAFWNSSRHVVMARRALPSGAWSTFEFTDYSLSADDAHNTVSIGICPGDGTLHLSFDHHSNNLHYRKSVAGIVTNPATATWAASSFSATTVSIGYTRMCGAGIGSNLG